MKNSFIGLLILIISLNFYCKEKEKVQEKPDNPEPTESIQPDPSRAATPTPTVPSPTGLRNIQEAKGDLDNDGIDELLIVYDTKNTTELGTEREIHIFKQESQEWNLWQKITGPVLPSEHGGMMGDPFQNLKIENRVIIITHMGGSKDKWNYTHRFRYQENNWYLIGATITYYTPCEETKTYDLNLSTSKLEKTISKETCDASGEIQPNAKTRKKGYKLKNLDPVQMDKFNPGSNELGVPGTSEESFFY